MENLVDFALREKYSEVAKRNSGLEELDRLVDWDGLVACLPDRTPEHAGRRPVSHKVMVKVLCLQAWHNLSDEGVEFQLHDRHSFQKFLNYERPPDAKTIWSYRQWLEKSGLLENLWDSLESQYAKHNVKIRKGQIQDATFVHADPGKKNSGMNDRGLKAKTSRQKDASWTKKGMKSIFGYKAHVKIDLKTKLVTALAVTTAKTHDNKIDLAKPNETIYRDRGYSGSKTRADINRTMKKGNLNKSQKAKNKRIAKTRSRGEHPFATIKRSFKGSSTKLTTLSRVLTQQTFQYIAYNIHRLKHLTQNTTLT